MKSFNRFLLIVSVSLSLFAVSAYAGSEVVDSRIGSEMDSQMADDLNCTVHCTITGAAISSTNPVYAYICDLNGQVIAFTSSCQNEFEMSVGAPFGMYFFYVADNNNSNGVRILLREGLTVNVAIAL